MRPIDRHLALILTLGLGAFALAAQQPEDVSKLDAATLLQRASSGDLVAERALAAHYSFGLGVPKDYPKAVEWFTKAANAGDAASQFDLATLYQSGLGVPHDDAKAAEWFRKAADQNLALAQYNLGYLYRTGEGVPHDDGQAILWYRKAAEQNYSAAQSNLGFMYLNGYGIIQDYAQALFWYRKAAAQHYPAAQTSLGYMYDNGLGVTADPVEAMSLYREAAEEGFPEAEFDLANIYKAGTTVPQDLTQARFWYRKAADQKYQPAQDALAKLDAAPAVPHQPSAIVGAITSLDSTPTRGGVPEPASPADSAAVSVPIPHNYALIFATDDYAHWPHLANPIPDADAVNDTLTSLYGFHVEEVRNATDDQILAKLTEYLHRKFEPQDQLLIFFSGHGYFDPDLGKGFLVPANALLVKDDIGHRTLLAHETIMGYVNRIPSKHVVLVLDACFSGTLDRRIADSGLKGDPTTDPYAHASLPELLARKEPKRTRRYITSGGKDFVPDGLPGHHSPFISAMLTTLNEAADRKGYVTLDDIQQGLDSVKPEPRWGEIEDDNDPGADLLLLTPNAVAQLTKPQ